MNDSLFNWVLILEIVFPFLLLSLVLITILVRNKSRVTEAMRELIINVKDNEDEQKQATKAFIQNKLGQTPEQADKLANEIIKERKFFFRSLVSNILNKDIENLATLDEELGRVFEKYHVIEGGETAPVATASVAESVGDDSSLRSEIESKEAKIEELKQDNKSLKQQNHITLTTLNNIFAEYSSMFGEEVTKKDMSVEQILTAMESFAGPSISSASIASETPVEATPRQESESAIVPSDEEPSDDDFVDTSILDELMLEQVNAGNSADDASDEEESEEPSWDDAFAESGDEMGKES